MVALAHSEISVRATPAAVMAVIADLADYPLWSEAVVSGEVLELGPDGRPRRAAMRLEVGSLTESCEFEYQWQGDERVDWQLVSGGLISQLHGTYTCRNNGDGTTTVGYDLDLELVVPLIGSVKQKGTRRIVRSALRSLRGRSEAIEGLEPEAGEALPEPE